MQNNVPPRNNIAEANPAIEQDALRSSIMAQQAKLVEEFARPFPAVAEEIKINDQGHEPGVFDGDCSLDDGFRFQSKRGIFTFAGHINKEKLLNHILTKANSPKAKFIRAAHENADPSHPYLHTHVVVEFGKKLDITGSRRFDIPVGEFESFGIAKDFDNKPIHPNWKKIESAEHWKNSVKYLGKEDQDNADLVEPPNAVAKCWSYATKAEAIKEMCGTVIPGKGASLSLANAISTIYDNKPAEAPEAELEDPRPWQQHIIDIASKPCRDRRSVYWITDPQGGAGKSLLSEYLDIEIGAYVIDCDMGHRDLATALGEATRAGWNADCVVFDISRSGSTDIYEAIEAVKNKRITERKYKSGTTRFRRQKGFYTHVFVFSNERPNFARLSSDRWRFYEIRKDGMDFTDESRKRHGLPESAVAEGPPNADAPMPEAVKKEIDRKKEVEAKLAISIADVYEDLFPSEEKSDSGFIIPPAMRHNGPRKVPPPLPSKMKSVPPLSPSNEDVCQGPPEASDSEVTSGLTPDLESEHFSLETKEPCAPEEVSVQAQATPPPVLNWDPLPNSDGLTSEVAFNINSIEGHPLTSLDIENIFNEYISDTEWTNGSLTPATTSQEKAFAEQNASSSDATGIATQDPLQHAYLHAEEEQRAEHKSARNAEIIK